MSDKTELQKVSEETMRFIRGKYVLDEVGDGKDKESCLMPCLYGLELHII